MSKIKVLYAQIEEELETCDPEQTPIICSNLSHEEDKACLVQTIAEFVLSMHLNISQAIVEVEKSFDVNNEA